VIVMSMTLQVYIKRTSACTVVATLDEVVINGWKSCPCRSLYAPLGELLNAF
jgi:hypothetical protein